MDFRAKYFAQARTILAQEEELEKLRQEVKFYKSLTIGSLLREEVFQVGPRGAHKIALLAALRREEERPIDEDDIMRLFLHTAAKVKASGCPYQLAERDDNDGCIAALVDGERVIMKAHSAEALHALDHALSSSRLMMVLCGSYRKRIEALESELALLKKRS
jgi:hypothetical protein